MADSDASCPFCRDGGFDLPGLAKHIEQGCNDARRALDQFDAEMSEFYMKLAARAKERG